MAPFELGKQYKRTSLHAEHGGQRQGGISTPANKAFLMLFTGKGSKHGYDDTWHEGVFRYFGEGQVGDMTFTAGNKAIRDSTTNGKELHLFANIGRGLVRYLGDFTCSTYEWTETPDTNGNLRKAIAFHLVPLEHDAMVPYPPSIVPLDILRKQAITSATEAGQASFKEARRIAYDRSRAVREYVLARAGGQCEACRKPAPFARENGQPYLEPHHTRRLSDGGADHPRWVGGICPNCHREIHYGKDGTKLNDTLQKYLEINY